MVTLGYDEALKVAFDNKTDENRISGPELCKDIFNNKKIKLQYKYYSNNYLYKYPYYILIKKTGTEGARINNLVFYADDKVIDYLKRCFEAGSWLKN